MRRYAALVNLALVFVLMFGAAFSCGQNNNDRKSSTQTSENTDRTPRLDRPTEEDVRQLVTRRKEATSIESVEFGSSHRASLNDQDKGVPEDATVYAV